MVERSFSDPESMVGASAEEVAAMKPEGWLMLPFPDGRPGFHLLDPGHPAGASGSMSYHFGTPGFRTFTVRPSAAVFVLNEALELPALGTLAQGFAEEADGSYSASHVAILADTARILLASGLLRVWEDPLDNDPARLLKNRSTVSAVESHLHRLLDDHRADNQLAPSVLFVDVTEKGRRALRSLDTKPLKLKPR